MPKSLPESMKAYTWKPGQSGNPKGMAVGTKHKLTEDFLRELHADFVAHGKDAITKVREDDPAVYFRVIASLVPKDMNLNLNDQSNLDTILDGLPEAELAAFTEGLRLIISAGQSGAKAKAKADKGALPGVH